MHRPTVHGNNFIEHHKHRTRREISNMYNVSARLTQIYLNPSLDTINPMSINFINQTAACLVSRSAAGCNIGMMYMAHAYSFPSCYLTHFLYYVFHMTAACLVPLVDMVQAHIILISELL